MTESQQHQVIDLAVSSREDVKRSYEVDERERAGKRSEKMLRDHTKHEIATQKLKLEREKLLKEVHLVTTTEELDEALEKVESHFTTTSKRKTEKLTFLRNQIKYRKKVLQQKIQITFSTSGRQRSIIDIIGNLKEFIQQNPIEHSFYLKNPYVLVGRRISHRFELPESGHSTRWYDGTVLEFNETTREHTVIYDGEDEPCCYDLTYDLSNEDLKII